MKPLLTRLTGDEKHGPSAYSTLDVLWVLYDRVLDVAPDRLDDPVRDRFLLSKGHGPAAYYAVLAAKGFIPHDWLDDMAGPDSPLGHHPDRLRVPGVEVSTGSLGHGLGLATGTALGLRAQGLTKPHVTAQGLTKPVTPHVTAQGSTKPHLTAQGLTKPVTPHLTAQGSTKPVTPHVYVLLGDAELDEGSNHEAIAFIGATALDSITAIVVDNGSASYTWPGGLETAFTVHGWSASTVDGRDHEAIFQALTHREGKPHAVVAKVEQKGS